MAGYILIDSQSSELITQFNNNEQMKYRQVWLNLRCMNHQNIKTKSLLPFSDFLHTIATYISGVVSYSAYDLRRVFLCVYVCAVVNSTLNDKWETELGHNLVGKSCMLSCFCLSPLLRFCVCVYWFSIASFVML